MKLTTESVKALDQPGDYCLLVQKPDLIGPARDHVPVLEPMVGTGEMPDADWLQTWVPGCISVRRGPSALWEEQKLRGVSGQVPRMEENQS